ncbi:MAG: hypothetical protein ACRDRN_19610 [Sciscionella sp.]
MTGSSALHEVLAQLAAARSAIDAALASVARSRQELAEARTILGEHIPRQDCPTLGKHFTMAESRLELIVDRLERSNATVASFAEAL